MGLSNVILFDERCLEYDAPGHPEGPERIRRAFEFLRAQGVYRFERPQPASEDDLLKVHTPEHLERIKNLEFYDPDSPRYENIYEYARLSAGGAIAAMRHRGFSLMRPPGHHASRARVAGFCYFNNLAIAVCASNKKTLIVDIDGHHGDGTQAIFLGDPQVVFISLHSSPNYPGTGLRSEQNCWNYPLPFHCGEEVYLETLERALSAVDPGEFEQLAISAGFDTYERDPLASLGLRTESYLKIGRRLAALELPTFAVLEGGYDVEALGPNIHAFLQGLSQGGT
jgi:acetoin utilization deacetylase AcuC-like enzyme